MTLIQITRRTGTIKRVPRGEKPVVELHLKPDQRVLNFALRQRIGVSVGREHERKTVDWVWEADLECRAAPEVEP